MIIFYHQIKISIVYCPDIRYLIGRQKTNPTSLQSNQYFIAKFIETLEMITFYQQINILIVYCIDLRYLIGWQKNTGSNLVHNRTQSFIAKFLAFSFPPTYFPPQPIMFVNCHARQVLVVLCNPSWADPPLVAKVSQLVTRCIKQLDYPTNIGNVRSQNFYEQRG